MKKLSILIVLSAVIIMGCHGHGGNGNLDKGITPPPGDDECTVSLDTVYHQTRNFDAGNGITGVEIVEYLSSDYDARDICTITPPVDNPDDGDLTPPSDDTPTDTPTDNPGDDGGDDGDKTPTIVDTDGDTVPDSTDNCVNIVNPNQEDLDHDGIGDACDSDLDGDMIDNEVDNCVDVANHDQADYDHDNIGDVCDDSDGDTVYDDIDNCRETPNLDQADVNENGIGDACETPGDDNPGDDDGTGDENPGDDDGNNNGACYAYLDAAMPFWQTQEELTVDPRNNAGLNEAYVVAQTRAAINHWNAHVDGKIYSKVTKSKINDRSTIGVTINGVNEVIFKDIGDPRAIAAVYVFFKDSEMIEADIILDDTNFPWSKTGELNTLDFRNVIQHETGYTIGLYHPSSSECSDETMWFITKLGETSKRHLHSGDIAGAQSLYGAPGNSDK